MSSAAWVARRVAERLARVSHGATAITTRSLAHQAFANAGVVGGRNALRRIGITSIPDGRRGVFPHPSQPQTRGFASPTADSKDPDDDRVVDLDREEFPLVSERVVRLADDICSLTLLEVHDMTTILTKRLGLSGSPMPMMGMGGGGGAPAAGGGAPAEPEKNANGVDREAGRVRPGTENQGDQGSPGGDGTGVERGERLGGRRAGGFEERVEKGRRGGDQGENRESRGESRAGIRMELSTWAARGAHAVSNRQCI
mmetsp:Transcript_2143/g.7431  ORF Transcript_2143/g.7431 Transcript_2143/m.7431 type:complete len:256 (-) Transcript_2143:686-1453(-)